MKEKKMNESLIFGKMNILKKRQKKKLNIGQEAYFVVWENRKKSIKVHTAVSMSSLWETFFCGHQEPLLLSKKTTHQLNTREAIGFKQLTSTLGMASRCESKDDWASSSAFRRKIPPAQSTLPRKTQRISRGGATGRFNHKREFETEARVDFNPCWGRQPSNFRSRGF